MRPILAVTAGLLMAALVAAGVTLAILGLQARTNTQQVNLRNGVTISEDSAIITAAGKARPAVVSIVTQHQPSLVRGSGGLPTLGFADPTALVQGQRIVAVGGPVEGNAVTPGYVSAMHRVTSANDPVNLGRTLQFSDTIQTNAAIEGGMAGGPLLNVGSQVIGVAMESPSSLSGFGLNVADIVDDVQQILSTGQVMVSSLGATTADVTAENAALNGTPEGSRLVTLDKTGPVAAAGLKPADVITQIDDVRLDAAHPLSLLLRSRFHANQRVTVTYSRDGASTQAELTLTSQHPTCT